LAENFEGEGLHLWHPFIYKFHFDFSPYFDDIYANFQKLSNHWATETDMTIVESGDGWSTTRVGMHDADMQPHFQPHMQDYHAWLGNRIGWVWDQFGYLSRQSEISKSWFNRHGLGAQTLEHTHNAVELVVASYIKNDPGQGFIEFRDPLEYHKTGYPYNAEKEIWKPVSCQTGDVLIFPGWLNHRTQQNDAGGERICMTYNINSRLLLADVQNKFRI
jgi:uncharacterized protein (TIGR02466 family)